MTTILNLPDEILLLIFSYSHQRDLCTFQRVCHAWSTPARLAILREPKLCNYAVIVRFITTFNHHPKPEHLKDIKKLYIDNINEQHAASPSVDTISKLFFPFPNLGQVTMYCSLGFLDNFNDDLCLAILKKCPRLDAFTLYIAPNDGDPYREALCKLRYLMTGINMNDVVDISRFNGIEGFLLNFPRLKRIDGDVSFLNIQEFLRVLHQLPDLTAFSLKCSQDDSDDFTENYLTTKVEGRQLVKRLSEIKHFSLGSINGYFLNSLMFVTKYMTGLNSLKLSCHFIEPTVTVKQRLFCSFMLDLVRSVNECRVEICMVYNSMKELLASIMHKLFLHPVTNTKRTVKISIVDKNGPVRIPEFIIATNQQKSQQSLLLNFTQDVNIGMLLPTLFHDSPTLNCIDTFEFQLSSKNYASMFTTNPLSAEGLGCILKAFPSLKYITLDIPPSFMIGFKDAPSDKLYPLAESLTLRFSASFFTIDLQIYSDWFHLIFPNLKHLSLNYYCGVWKPNIAEFQLELGKFAIESLTVDVTPIKRHVLTSRTLNGNEFFIVELTVLCNSDRVWYKIPFNLSHATRIEYSELKGLTRGKDYIQQHVTIFNVQHFKLCMYKHPPLGSSDTYMHQDLAYKNVNYLTLF